MLSLKSSATGRIEMGKFVFAVIFVLLPHFAFAANMCVRLFADATPKKYDFSQVDSTNMSSVDYLMLQHRKWQQRTGIEYYTKEQLHEFTMQAKQGNPQALENLMVSNIPMVIREVAKKVSRSNPIFSELVSQTLLGVYAVVERYKPTKENANFIQALKHEVRNVLKNHRKNVEVIDYGVKYYNEVSFLIPALKEHYQKIGKELTPELLVAEYKSRQSEELTLQQAKKLLLEVKFDTVRESTETGTGGFTLSSLKDKSELSNISSLSEITYVHRTIDQIKSELKNSEFVQVFELLYGLTKKGAFTEANIADMLNIPQYRVKWIIRDKIKKSVQKVLQDKEFDRDVFQQGIMTYAEKDSIRPVETKNVHKQFKQIYVDFLNNKTPLESARELRKIESEILKTKDKELIFEFKYFMVEILLEAKKYDLAMKKSEELLEAGKHWNEHHQHFSMLHHSVGKSAYHVGNLKQAEKHLRHALVIKGAYYETWFYYAKTMEKLNSTTNFENSFKSYILSLTSLRRLFREPLHTLSAKQLDKLKTIEHLSEMGLKESSRILRNAHGFNSITIEAIRSYTESKQKNDHIGIIKALQPLFEALYQTPKKRLQKLNLEGPTKKAFEVLFIDLAKSFKATGQIQQHEKVVGLLKEL